MGFRVKFGAYSDPLRKDPKMKKAMALVALNLGLTIVAIVAENKMSTKLQDHPLSHKMAAGVGFALVSSLISIPIRHHVDIEVAKVTDSAITI